MLISASEDWFLHDAQRLESFRMLPAPFERGSSHTPQLTPLLPLHFDRVTRSSDHSLTSTYLKNCTMVRPTSLAQRVWQIVFCHHADATLPRGNPISAAHSLLFYLLLSFCWSLSCDSPRCSRKWKRHWSASRRTRESRASSSVSK